MLSKKNISILVCVLLIVILLSYYFVFKKKHTCKIITPQCLFGALLNNSRILLVNVLSDKIPVFIGVEKPDPLRSISKSRFEEILKNNNIPEDIDLVILMCAGWSCSAAKNYYEELKNRGVNVSRIVDYAGGFHEWCLYNKLNSSLLISVLSSRTDFIASRHM